MKRILLSLLLVLPLAAAPKIKDATLEAGNKARKTAAGLIQQGKVDEAVAHLQANLPRRAGANDDALDLSQSLVQIALGFMNRQQLQLARKTAEEAMIQAEPLLKKSSPGDASIASLYLNLGLLCEDVFYDLSAAQNYYQAVATARPGDEQAKKRLQHVQDKKNNQVRNQKAGRS